MLNVAVAWSAILGAIIVAATFVRSMIRAGRAERERQQGKRRDARREALAEGRASRDDEVQLLRSQRDDARRERDTMRNERDDWRRRYQDLIELRGRPRPE